MALGIKYTWALVKGDIFFKDLLRYPLGREGVYAQMGLPS